MRHIILIAESGDFIGEKKLIAQHLNGEWRDGVWHMNGKDWEVLVTGVGALNVMRALRDIPRDANLINIGYAGSANFDIGSVVQVTHARLNHPAVQYPEPELPLQSVPVAYLREPDTCLSAICYSNTDFVLQSDYRDCVFDMELAFIAGLGFDTLSSIKIVSDNLSLHTYREVAAGVDEV